ncbi:DUF6527 family protein [Fodinicurvata fenggangensis]|uniref:DUF6527 family protein n=1 Tax=Fodinicurvata fenggangensis TaxID=1121830 RepID=UPI0009E090BC|nr:DUF6527 family protein [Fodinicurvata fenggangensis]
MMTKVKALLVEDIDAVRVTPGAYEFTVRHGEEDPCGMIFNCPCGCGREGYLPFKPEPSPSWLWDGNREAPTLRPSVLQIGGCRWHGFLTAGEWRSC